MHPEESTQKKSVSITLKVSFENAKTARKCNLLSEDMLVASCKIVYRITSTKKRHTAAEELIKVIKPCLIAIVDIFLHQLRGKRFVCH